MHFYFISEHGRWRHRLGRWSRPSGRSRIVSPSLWSGFQNVSCQHLHL